MRFVRQKSSGNKPHFFAPAFVRTPIHDHETIPDEFIYRNDALVEEKKYKVN